MNTIKSLSYICGFLTLFLGMFLVTAKSMPNQKQLRSGINSICKDICK